MALERTKGLYQELKDYFDSIGYEEEMDPAWKDYKFGDLLTSDVIKFVFYVASVKGDVSEKKIGYLADLTDLEIGDVESGLFMSKFNFSDPESRTLFIFQPLKSFLLCLWTGKNKDAVLTQNMYEKLIELFKQTGIDVISVEGVATAEEATDLKAFLGALTTTAADAMSNPDFKFDQVPDASDDFSFVKKRSPEPEPVVENPVPDLTVMNDMHEVTAESIPDLQTEPESPEIPETAEIPSAEETTSVSVEVPELSEEAETAESVESVDESVFIESETDREVKVDPPVEEVQSEEVPAEEPAAAPVLEEVPAEIEPASAGAAADEMTEITESPVEMPVLEEVPVDVPAEEPAVESVAADEMQVSVEEPVAEIPADPEMSEMPEMPAEPVVTEEAASDVFVHEAALEEAAAEASVPEEVPVEMSTLDEVPVDIPMAEDIQADLPVEEPSAESVAAEEIEVPVEEPSAEIPVEPVEEPIAEPSLEPVPEIPSVPVEEPLPEMAVEPDISSMSEIPAEPEVPEIPEMPAEPVIPEEEASDVFVPEAALEEAATEAAEDASVPEKVPEEMPVVEEVPVDIPMPDDVQADVPVEEPAAESVAAEEIEVPDQEPLAEIPTEPVEEPIPEMPAEPVEEPLPEMPAEPDDLEIPEIPVELAVSEEEPSADLSSDPMEGQIELPLEEMGMEEVPDETAMPELDTEPEITEEIAPVEGPAAEEEEKVESEMEKDINMDIGTVDESEASAVSEMDSSDMIVEEPEMPVVSMGGSVVGTSVSFSARMSVEDIIANVSTFKKTEDKKGPKHLDISIGENGSSYIALKLKASQISEVFGLEASGDTPVMLLGNNLNVGIVDHITSKNLLTGEVLSREQSAEVVDGINESISISADRNYRRINGSEKFSELLDLLLTMSRSPEYIDSINGKISDADCDLHVTNISGEIPMVCDDQTAVHSIAEILLEVDRKF